MATIFGVTSLELTEEQEKALSAALIKDLGTLYTHAPELLPQQDPPGGRPRGRRGSDHLLCLRPTLHSAGEKETDH